MANGWPNFSFVGAFFEGNYPKNAVLDARETVWESKPAADSSAVEYRKVQTVQIHVNCNSDSATSTNSALDSLLSAQTIVNPVVKVGMRDGSVADKTLTGTWQIERISEGHNGDGTCRVDIVLVQRGEWPTS
jgi:hypothetical protein